MLVSCALTSLQNENRMDANFEGKVKNGTCPFLSPPELCVSDVDECFIDWDCVGNRKCCSNGCYKVCASPSVGGGGVGQLQTAEAGTIFTLE